MQLIQRGLPAPSAESKLSSFNPAARGLARISITLALALAGVGLGSTTARAEGNGTLTMRGAYYKERATRVIQPMLDGTFSVGDHGTADAHLLVDAITSASASSGAADEPFTERRYEVGAGYAHELPLGKLRGDFRLSSEPDYRSLFGTVGAELAFAEDNTIVGLGLGGGHDEVSNAGAQGPFSAVVEGSLDTFLATASVSQLLSPDLVVSAGYDVSHLRGFQQNPYRFVIVDTVPLPEHHPETRTRHALAATGKWFLPTSKTTAIGSYRFYADSWGVLAHTPEVRVIQPLGDLVEVAARYRFHQQSAADFYQRAYEEVGDDAHVSDDEKLSAFTTHTIEGRLAMLGELLGFTGILGEARGELLVQYIQQNNRFGDAIAAQVALTLPFTY